MKKSSVTVIVLVSLSYFFYGADSRISIIDFAVHSDNTRLKYVGKGLSEMIAVELRKSPGITLVEREKRSALLEEMEFSVSDLADADTQAKIGKLLSADHLLYGEIVDMGDSILITPRLVEVETGNVAWSGMLTEKIDRYEYIAAYFSKSILDYLNVKVVESTNRKLEEKSEKNADVVIAFSNAIDHYDKKETEEAKLELEKAKAIDPANEAVNLYVQKLAGLSPKFRVELERYAPTNNPAMLGLLDRDELFFWLSMPVTGVSKDDQSDYGGGLYGHEVTINTRAGYVFPLGDTIGISLDYISSHQDNSIDFPYTITDYNGDSTNRMTAFPTNQGGSLGLGWRVVEQFSIGAAFHFFNHGKILSNITDPGMIIEGNYFAVDGGAVFQAFDQRLLVDLQAVYSNQPELYYDKTANKVQAGNVPIIVDGTITGSLAEKTLFLACKSVTELYFDSRGGVFQRAIPILEYWPLQFVSIRGGYELSCINQSGTTGIGNGFLVGLSVKLGEWGINANFSYRNKPLHLMPGYQISQGLVLIGLTYSPGILKR